MPERESDPGFTFVDRRRRAAEDESPAPPRGAPAPPPAPPPAAAAASPEPRPAGGPAGSLLDLEGGAPRADLASLCVMLYSEALMHLGQVPDPATGQPHVDVEQARFPIDLLGMLQQKTAGNRTPDESAMLEEMLAALRMAFVRATRR